MKAYKSNNDYKIKKSADEYSYYKYQWTGDGSDLITPAFDSIEEAANGKDGVKFVATPDFWTITRTSTGSVSIAPNYVIIDVGAYGIKSLVYTSQTSPHNYPSLILSNIQASDTMENWTMIRSGNFGSENATSTLNIPYPNNYRYIKFSMSTTDWAYPSAGGRNFKITYVNNKRNVIAGTSSDYDFKIKKSDCKAFNI